MTEAFDNEDIPLSKTKRKQEMESLQDLGAALVELSQDKLNQLDLPDNLITAIKEAKKLTNARGAQRRQLQYIGKIMRTVDPAPIQAKLDAWSGVTKEETAKLHLIERWRERLLGEESALRELLDGHAHVDSQQLRTLIRNAHKEREANKPPKSSRALFKMLREIFLSDEKNTAAPDNESDEQI